MKNDILIKYIEKEEDVVCGLNECHDYLRLVFSNFQAFCDKYQIDCFLIWGSLLGCERSGGIIPWDDDMDLALLDDDVDKFIQALPFLNEFGLAYYHFSNTNEMCSNVFRIYKDGFYEILTDVRNKYLSPVYIDIFIGKKISKSINADSRRKIDKKLQKYYHTLAIKESRRPSSNKIKGLIRICARNFLKIIYPQKKLHKKIEYYCRKLYLNDDNYEYFFPDTMYHVPIITYEKRLLKPLRKASFEGVVTKVPLYSDELLTKIYHNWRIPLDESGGQVYKKPFVKRTVK